MDTQKKMQKTAEELAEDEIFFRTAGTIGNFVDLVIPEKGDGTVIETSPGVYSEIRNFGTFSFSDLGL